MNEITKEEFDNWLLNADSAGEEKLAFHAFCGPTSYERQIEKDGVKYVLCENVDVENNRRVFSYQIVKVEEYTVKVDKNKLTSELEKVLTVDGRGRPKKAQLLIELLRDTDAFMDVLKEISERKGL